MTLSRKTLLTVLGVALVSTVIHYTDNYINIAEYPQPDWINKETIYIAWGLLTLLGVAGYLFYRHGHTTAAGIYLLLYSYTGLSSLGHYLYGGADDFTGKMHAMIWLDGITGAAVAVCALMVLFSREHKPN